MLATLIQKLQEASSAQGMQPLPASDLMAETGSVLFSDALAMRYADLQNLVIPGLRQLGIIAAEHLALPPAQASELSVPFYLSALPDLMPPEPPEPACSGEAVPPVWMDTNPEIRADQTADHQVERWLRLARVEKPLPKTERCGPMLLRWCAMEASRRNQGLKPPGGSASAECLMQLAGRQTSPICVRMRRAATQMNANQCQAAWLELTDAMCIQLYIPSGLHAALLSPPEERLSPVHRRELIYAARSGTACLRALAAARLHAAAANYEVLRTLEQLKYDSDAWVRSAVGPLPPRR
jgi:hypothetical protein